ncbi:MAG: LysR family transcriptional regulator, partial [Oscillospiraceae bacterium]|nr:LysR family transcriptional regulator [Oscillospiraceae bacterium]
MDYKQLEAFSAVVKYSSFSKAADFLYLSQPTVSAHIASLEQELNTKLFLRNGRETIPTAAGEMLFAYSEKILQLREEAVKAVVDAQQNAIPSISIASSTVPSQLYLSKFMSSYREINPKAVFSVYHGDSDEA